MRRTDTAEAINNDDAVNQTEVAAIKQPNTRGAAVACAIISNMLGVGIAAGIYYAVQCAVEGDEFVNTAANELGCWSIDGVAENAWCTYEIINICASLYNDDFCCCEETQAEIDHDSAVLNAAGAKDEMALRQDMLEGLKLFLPVVAVVCLAANMIAFRACRNSRKPVGDTESAPLFSGNSAITSEETSEDTSGVSPQSEQCGF
ncbi:MAG: hypothetical protein COB66_01105 [Coxiella sp. (in: Bacteria)]|nr:MAG: hypothetical protein COB66_01105 [Coxiella sp. (in: g-proteobacteria)]